MDERDRIAALATSERPMVAELVPLHSFDAAETPAPRYPSPAEVARQVWDRRRREDSVPPTSGPGADDDEENEDDVIDWPDTGPGGWRKTQARRDARRRAAEQPQTVKAAGELVCNYDSGVCEFRFADGRVGRIYVKPESP